MKFEATLFRSKVAWRIFGLFVLSALIPVTTTAILSFNHVTDLLTRQGQTVLHDAGKAFGMSLYERLLFAQDKLRQIASDLPPGGLAGARGRAPRPKQFRAVALVRLSGDTVPLFGEVPHWPELSGAARAHLAAGKDVLSSAAPPGGPAAVFLSQALDPRHPERGRLAAQLDPAYLWGGADKLPFMTDICILDGTNTTLFCSHPIPASVTAQTARQLAEAPSGPLYWEDAGAEYLAAYWRLFLRPQFFVNGWTIVASQPRSQTLAPIASFKTLFFPAILVSVLVALLLSVSQLRRSLIPLEKLTAGTRRIANREFASTVDVSSGDEFEELATSFNAMAAHLGRQFRTLTTLSEIDRAILSTPDLDRVLKLVLLRVCDISPCDLVALTVLDRDAPQLARIYVAERHGEDHPVTERAALAPEDLQALLAQPAGFMADAPEDPRPYLAPLAARGADAIYVLPIVLEDQLAGIVSLGFREPPVLGEDELAQARDLADRVAVAISAAARDEQLYLQAHFDNLTGLPNRQLMKDRLAQEIIHAHREDHMLALLSLDLDRFKNINDALGHEVGDQLLARTAERLKDCVRETDTVARLGDDEFTVILSRISAPRNAAIIAQNIIHALAEPYIIGNHENFISASIGITVFPGDGDSGEELLKNADTALYRVKESGRGHYLFFTEKMNAEATERAALERALHRALERDELVLYYQPQVCLRTGRVAGAEALLRWQHPTRGLLSPARFIPVAEETGLVEPIGEWVLHSACRQYRDWRAEGAEPLRLAVNVSSRQIRQRNFVQIVRAALADTSIPPADLELELTESLLLEDARHTMDTFDELHALGIRLSIDDFGTGYSALGYLRRFPIDTLKIDRSFVQDLPDDNDAAAIATSIIAMAHNLKLDVVAEGVETGEQLAFLRKHRCDLIQGYYYERPLPPEQFAEFLRRWDSA